MPDSLPIHSRISVTPTVLRTAVVAVVALGFFRGRVGMIVPSSAFIPSSLLDKCSLYFFLDNMK